MRQYKGAAALVLLLTGCDFIRDPIGIDLPVTRAAVHSILRAGSDTVSVMLTRVRFDGLMGAPRPGPVSGANVRIAAGTDTVRLAEAPDGFAACIKQAVPGFFEPPTNERAGPGCYAAILPGGVRPGGRYRLEVRLPTAQRVHGLAAVPDLPRIVTPAAHSHVRLAASGTDDATGGPEAKAKIPVRVTGIAPEGSYIPGLTGAAVFLDGERVPGGECRPNAEWRDAVYLYGRGRPLEMEADSLNLLLFGVFCAVPADSNGLDALVVWDSVHARLRVTAFDSVYTRYVVEVMDNDGSVRRERAGLGLTGASGVFAGAATAKRMITLLPDQGYTERQIDYFLDVAAYRSEAGAPARIRKWLSELRLTVHGAPTPRDLMVLANVSTVIEELSGLDILINAGSSNIDMYFVPRSEFADIEPNYSGASPGFFWVWWDLDTGAIVRARIMIASDTAAALRTHLIREFLTHALGFFNGSPQYDHSIFYSDSSAVNEYAPIDRRLIRMLYRDEVRSGMTRDEAAAVLRRLER